MMQSGSAGDGGRRRRSRSRSNGAAIQSTDRETSFNTKAHSENSAVNIVFMSIDWKASRHNAQEARATNFSLLEHTIKAVVQQMTPMVICMYAVGEAGRTLNSDQTHLLINECMSAWSSNTVESADLCFMSEAGAPYIIIYDSSKVQCSCHRIIHEVYSAREYPGTAQAFLCHGTDGNSIDVINVHAPSDQTTLTNVQRKDMLLKLLQSDSKSRPGYVIGDARFVIGGEMNINRWALSRMLPDGVFAATSIDHGYLCVFAGFNVDYVKWSGENYDPQNMRYCIAWSCTLDAFAPRDVLSSDQSAASSIINDHQNSIQAASDSEEVQKAATHPNTVKS